MNRARDGIVGFGVLFLICGCAESSREGRPREAIPARQVEVPQFDANRSYQYLIRQTNFGPRAAGSAGHEQCLQYLSAELRSLADTLELQPFSYSNSRIGTVALTNIVAHFSGGDAKRLLLMAHWDTRPWADADANPNAHELPIAGANDGASGVAVLLELARQFKAHAPPIGVSIVLVDGEDLGTSGKADSWCPGSKYFASHLPAGLTFSSAINLDMVGDAELLIKREQRSDKWAPEIADLIFKTAEELGIHQFSNSSGDDVMDDHVALNEVGIRAVDLIDFDYPNAQKNYWHTMQDTPDKCSPESLSAVGTLLLHLLYSKHQQL